MPRKGYKCVCINNALIERIDLLITKTLKSRPKIIEASIVLLEKKWKRLKK